VRQIVSVVTMIAVVLHLAVGCCLHPAHFAAGDACCHGSREDSDHEPIASAPPGIHGHHGGNADTGSCNHPAADPGAGADKHVAHASAEHGCAGCGCVATADGEGVRAATTCVVWVGDSLERGPVGMPAAARGSSAAAGWRQPSGHSTALFERFLA
jgi:hypothetical protein